MPVVPPRRPVALPSQAAPQAVAARPAAPPVPAAPAPAAPAARPAMPPQAMGPSKGAGPIQAAYANGGPVTGRTKSFMKVPDPFRTDYREQNYGSGSAPGKSGGSKATASNKVLKTVKPHKG